MAKKIAQAVKAVAVPEASKRQRWMMRIITGVDNRDIFVSAEEASGVISEWAFKQATKRLARGEAYSTTFEADARRIHAWCQTAEAPEVSVALKGRAWVFTPVSAKDGGFPTR